MAARKKKYISTFTGMEESASTHMVNYHKALPEYAGLFQELNTKPKAPFNEFRITLDMNDSASFKLLALGKNKQDYSVYGQARISRLFGYCGAPLLNSFVYNTYGNHGDDHEPDLFFNICFDFFEKDWVHRGGWSSIFYITSPEEGFEQIKLEKVLLTRNYIQSAEFINQNTSNECHLWIKQLNKRG